MMRKNLLIFSLVGTLLSCSGDNNHSSENQVTQKMKPSSIIFKKLTYGKKWPFSVDQIEVFCAGYHEIYFKTSGKIYTLNGSSKSASKNNPLIHSAKEIWLDDPEYPEIKIGLPDDFIRKGLELCEDY
jgi:hypothetical protein